MKCNILTSNKWYCRTTINDHNSIKYIIISQHYNTQVLKLFLTIQKTTSFHFIIQKKKS